LELAQLEPSQSMLWRKSKSSPKSGYSSEERKQEDVGRYSLSHNSGI
jgi:hypothetical protein